MTNQTAVNNTKWPSNISNDHKIYLHFPFQGPPKFTQIWDFWFENKNHLATLSVAVLVELPPPSERKK
jgi:hypothetical protein